jgi:ABC-type branched-subunit amino acid transport system ATPase component
MAVEFAIETEGLTKRFGEVVALSDLNLRVRHGCLIYKDDDPEPAL